MITIIALVLQVLMALVTPSNSDVVVIPASETQEVIEWEWAQYHAEAYLEYCDEFDAIFNGLTYKRAKNGRSMVNGKFVKMGV